MITKDQINVLKRMKNENHPWYNYIKSNADRTGTTSQVYADLGLWASLIYLVTDDKNYAGKAVTQCLKVLSVNPANTNHIRQDYIEYCIQYFILKGTLTKEQDESFKAGLQRWATYAIGRNLPKYTNGMGTSDSDALIGQYFGVVLTDILTGSEFSKGSNEADHLPKIQFGTKGEKDTVLERLIPTGKNFDTFRNAIAKYVEMAKGGVWIESSEYNYNTTTLLAMGCEAIRVITGTNYFPEFNEILPDLIKVTITDCLPDDSGRFEWGDEERSGDPVLWGRSINMCVLQGIAFRDSSNYEWAMTALDHINYMGGKFGFVGSRAYQPLSARAFLAFCPYSSMANWKDKDDFYVADGMGMVNWKTDNAMFTAHFQNPIGVHHETKQFGNVRLWMNGEWAVYNPVGYGGPSYDSSSHNNMRFRGFSCGIKRSFGGAALENGVLKVSGKTSGTFLPSNFYNPPPPYINSYERKVVYDPKGVIVCQDLFDVKDPTTLGKMDRYYEADRTVINSNPPAACRWHSKTLPTVEGGRVQYRTEKGQLVTITFFGSIQEIKVTKHTDLWVKHSFSVAQLGYAIDVVVDINSKELISVIEVGENPGKPTIEVVRQLKLNDVKVVL